MKDEVNEVNDVNEVGEWGERGYRGSPHSPLLPHSPTSFTSFTSAFLAVAAILVLATALMAHDTWLLPLTSSVPRGAEVTFLLTSGESFPTAESAIHVDRIDTAAVRLAGRILPLVPEDTTAHALRLQATLPDGGVGAVWVDLRPRTLDLAPDKVTEYLAEIGAADSVRARYERTSPRRWRERYRKHAKTFVRVGRPRRDASWSEPVGQFLEIVPERDPTTLRVGDTLVVRVLRLGVPLSGIVIGAVSEGGQVATLRTTDAAGRVRFVLDRASRWLLRGTELRAAPGPDLDWESDFVTLSFAVGNW